MNGNQTVGIPSAQAYPGFSQINLSSTESNVGTAGIVQNFLDNIFNYGDDLVWQHGRHTTKFGVQIVRYQQNNFYAGNYGALGQFIYNGSYTSDHKSGATDTASQTSWSTRRLRWTMAEWPDQQARASIAIHSMPG